MDQHFLIEQNNINSIIKNNEEINLIIKKHEEVNLIFEFLANQKSVRTSEIYAHELSKFFKEVFNKDPMITSVINIEQSHIVWFKKLLESQKIAPSTINLSLAAISSFYHFIVQKNLIQKNPCLYVKRVPHSKDIKTLDFSNEEVKKILGCVDCYTDAGSLHYAILVTLFFTGLRSGELLSIKNKDIETIDCKWHLKITRKGGEVAVLPLPKIVQQAISKFIITKYYIFPEIKGDDYLFTSTKNGSYRGNVPLYQSTLKYILKKYAKMAGVDHKFSVHSTRSTYIGMMLENGVSLRDVSTYVGHKDINLTSKYSKRKSLEKVASFIDEMEI